MLAKEKSLDEERKNIRLQADAKAFKHESEMQRLSSQATTKMLVASAIFFLIGVAVAIYFTGGSAGCLLYTSPSPRDRQKSRMPSSA